MSWAVVSCASLPEQKEVQVFLEPRRHSGAARSDGCNLPSMRVWIVLCGHRVNGETTSPDVKSVECVSFACMEMVLAHSLEAGAASGNKRTGGVLGTVYFRNFNLDLTAGNKFVSARAGTSVDLPWGLSFHTTMCAGAFQVARRVSDHNFDRFCALDLSAIGLQRLPVDAS